MKSIVITGGTRGIGFGMAGEFLRRGHRVAVCGRTAEGTERAIGALGAEHGAERVLGRPCDVGDHAQVEALWSAAAERFGRVDVWINNAGISNPRRDSWELPAELVDSVVRTNVLGVMHGSKVAMQGMLKQGYGQIYNMEGLGSDGMILPGAAPYGATKSAVTYFTKGFVKEARNTPVRVCFLGPGMVVTDLLAGGESAGFDDGQRRIANILADRVETVAPYLVDRILANDRHGVRIAWLNKPKIAWRFVKSPFSKRDLFAGAGTKTSTVGRSRG